MEIDSDIGMTKKYMRARGTDRTTNDEREMKDEIGDTLTTNNAKPNP